MVERLQTSLKETCQGATFVDLDGTLLRGNSMKMFMRRLPTMLMRRGAPLAAAVSLWWIGLRAFRAVSHRKMKWNLTKVARTYLKGDDWAELAGNMTEKIDPRVSAFVEESRKKGHRIYLATAAMGEYAVILGRMLNYDGVLATVFSSNEHDYVELKGVAKLNAVSSMLETESLSLESFISDHSDDLPMAREFPELTIIVHPAEKTESLFRAVGVRHFLK